MSEALQEQLNDEVEQINSELTDIKSQILNMMKTGNLNG